MGSSGPANDGVEGYAFEDFEQLDRIGAGGTADVYRASLNDGQERRVALKMPRVADHGTVDASFFDSFVEEASIWDRIDDHDNTVSVLDWGTEPYPWIAMEYMDAGHLGDRAAALNQEERVAAFRDVCDAVFHAHRHGITHGDLKPENVLFTRSSGTLVPKVGDWGLAKVLLEHSRSPEGLTMAYSAPEQLDPDAHGPVDDRTDVYQLSAVAYELFTGAPPFDASGTGELVHRILNDTPPPPSTRADVPAALDDAVLQGLAKEREERYESVLYLRDAVEAAMDEASSGTASRGAVTDRDVGASTDTADEATQSSAEAGNGRASTTNRRSTSTDANAGAESTTVRTTNANASATPETDTGPAATDADESESLAGRLHRPVESLNRGRDVARSIGFALHYPRSITRRTLYNWWLVAFASVLIVPAPIMVGYFLETVQRSAETSAPTFRLRDGAWLRHYRRGLVGGAFIFGPFLLFAAVSGASDPSGTTTTTAEGVLAMLTVLSWYVLPGLLADYATGGPSSLASLDHWRQYATLGYLGTVLGFVAVSMIAYLVTAGLAMTIVGIAVAYFYLMVAVGGFLGRRARRSGSA
ncbi:serine/threonine-protein kinase [Haloplanus pelagicus]|jgi:serine/threonine protein kinase|uniref:serine/threonine-protein kinase n=1 Tax=Haloplanus pelagicus TaxID=2949995 RepID=UPI00203B4E6B|nr:serine/threonine-protein kinase [Haloplanus sp. HW8-1]